MRILVVASDIPFPTIHGGRVDIYNRLVRFKKDGHQIDLIATCNDEVAADDLDHLKTLCSKVQIVKRRSLKKDFFSLKPWQIQCRKDLMNIQLPERYELVFLEGDYVYYILENKSLMYKQAILRVHNIEYKYFFNLSKSTFPKLTSLYYFSDSLKFRWFSKDYLYRRVRNLAFISYEEYKLYKDDRSLNCYHLFPSISSDGIKNFDVSDSLNDNVLFIGSLFMPNNRTGLKWYLENVHEKVLSEKRNYKLIVAGSSKGMDLTEFVRYCESFTNVEVHLNVPDLDRYYKQAAVFINPMLHGAGVKIKTVNAILNGLPLISTGAGAEGIGLINNRHVFIANQPNAFSDKILLLLNNKDIASKMVFDAQTYLLKNADVSTLLDAVNLSSYENCNHPG